MCCVTVSGVDTDLVGMYTLIRSEQEQWEKNDTFRETVRLSEGRPDFTFYDGPPFATGLPHYGHILAGDTICSIRIDLTARTSTNEV